MLKLTIDEAAQHLSHFHDHLSHGDSTEAIELMDNGRPALALLPWDLYTALVGQEHIATNPQQLLNATPATRRRELTIAAAQAESLYADPELLGFEAFGTDDLFDTPNTQ